MREILYRSFYFQVSRLRLLGDHMHSTRIAFVEFFMVCNFSDLNTEAWFLCLFPVMFDIRIISFLFSSM